MAADVFVDSSGFYALLSRKDERHRDADDFVRKASKTGRRFVTTDHVVDETATLLMARGLTELVPALFESVFASALCRISWMDSDRFRSAMTLLLRNLDRGWSFTDCASFAVMRELRLREALSKDHHFADAGFRALLA